MGNFSQADFGVVLMLAVLAIPMQLWRFKRLHAERLKTDRYPLFAARDRWIRLVAEGHLTEDDELFQFLYKDLNVIIPRAKPLTLRNIVVALRASRIVSDPDFARKCQQLLEHHDAQVRAATEECFGALVKILIGRSFFVRISVSLTHSGFLALSGLRRVLKHILKTETEAYRIHEKLRNLCPI